MISSETRSSFLSDDFLKPNQFYNISIPQLTPESLVESPYSSSICYLEGSYQPEATKDSAPIPDENESQVKK